MAQAMLKTFSVFVCVCYHRIPSQESNCRVNSCPPLDLIHRDRSAPAVIRVKSLKPEQINNL